MKIFTLLMVLISGSVSFGQNPPLQPGSGPGGSDYVHNAVIFSDFTSWLSADGYWLFEPDGPKPDSADVIVFNHGYGVFNPGPYGQWIEHLVRKGHIVIFPKYQLNDASLPSTYTPNAITGILDAFNELNTNPNRVKPRMQHLAMIGHSYGGVITSNLVTEYANYGTPKPQCFMLCQPGTGGINSGRINSYSSMDIDYHSLIIVGEDDIVVGDAFGREIMDSTLIPTSRKNYIIHHEDSHGSPVIEASHNEPLAANNDYDGGTISTVITGGYVASKIDAVDFYCYWKLADALMSCTFYGVDCDVAFGDTEAQKNMGQWSDGTDVLELTVEPSSAVNVYESSRMEVACHPNPVENLLFISSEEDQSFEILISSVSGELLVKKTCSAGTASVDVSQMPSGIYMVSFPNSGFKPQKIIKQ